jgi:hypothetical protein
MKLVAQTKNQRLKDLLAQTDNYLKRLSAMVAMERLEDYDRTAESAMTPAQRDALREKRAKDKGTN